MPQDDKDAPQHPPRGVKPPLPPGPARHPEELDDADLLSDEREEAAPAPPAPSPLNPFLPADAQPRDRRRVEPAATVERASASTGSASPHGEPGGEPAGVAPGSEPAPRKDLASSESPPVAPRKRSRAIIATLLLVPVVAIGVVFAYQAKSARDEQTRAASLGESSGRPTESAAPPLPSSYVEPPPPPTQSSPPPEKSVAARAPAKIPAARAPEPAASIPPGESGIIDTTHLPAGRKIVVNGRVIGFSPRRVAVRCGTIRVQIGDLPTESIGLPCGGEVTFTDE